jgi:hypothetical protein
VWKHRIKKIAVCAMLLVFSGLLFCFPAAAESTYTFDLYPYESVLIYYRNGDGYQMDSVMPEPWPNGNMSKDFYHTVDKVEVTFTFDEPLFLNTSSQYSIAWDVGVNSTSEAPYNGQAPKSYTVSCAPTGSDKFVTLGTYPAGEGEYHVLEGTISLSALGGVSSISQWRLVINYPKSAMANHFYVNRYLHITEKTQSDQIGDKIDESTDEILNGQAPGVGDTQDEAGQLQNDVDEYNKKEQETIDLLDNSVDEALLAWNPFNQLNYVALTVAFSGFTTAFNGLVSALGVHFTTVLAFAVCAGFFALLVGLVLRAGTHRSPPKD